MQRASRFSVVGLFVASVVLACGSSEDDRFECGNGSCARKTEVCLIGGTDRCSRCVPVPERCVATPTCGCLPALDDDAWGSTRCTDKGSCAEIDQGPVITCASPNWGCG